MRAVSKEDYKKGGHVPSYEVINVLTDGGLFDAGELYFYDYDENQDASRWEERRYEIAKDILANSHIAQQIGSYSYDEKNEVKDAVRMADLLIAELKRNKSTDD